MKRSLQAVVLVAALIVVFTAMAWVTAAALRLDRMQAESGQHAAFEENVRLALWRMETALAPLIARESARPYFVYAPFYPAARAYDQMLEPIAPGDLLVASPLLSESDSWVSLHFQTDAGGTVSSPEVPQADGALSSKAPPTVPKPSVVRVRRFGDLKDRLDVPRLFAALPATPARPPVTPQGGNLLGNIDNGTVRQQFAQGEQQQRAMNTMEWNARVSGQQEALFGNPKRPSSRRVEEGVLTPLWAGDLLLLARRMRVNGTEYVQGCWLDWPAIQAALRERIRDLLPEAALLPAPGSPIDGDGRRLAALPVRLEARETPLLPAARWSPIRLALAITWMCLLATSLAVALVLASAITLSERRAAFTSAVTHELRTPLTTFRVYTEMLAGGMVRGEEKRRDYLQTLHAEALRLSHLVENVLAYARLERGRHDRQRERISVGAILDRTADRLRQRAAQAGLELILPQSDEDRAPMVFTDVSAVEQILFNLIDNAAKYAAAAPARRVELSVEAAGRMTILRVRDYGPGIHGAGQRDLFKPFRKSAERAAASAPGVGLGLALSRRLARALGGDLRLDSRVTDGAAFELTLPRA
jgi:signal transduction histidine kinase